MGETVKDPIAIFRELFAEAAKTHAEPDAMVLSTADDAGQPSGRFVLLKAVDARGFVFYTNLESRKARDLAANPRAALCFYWAGIGKQVRIVGAVERVADAEADAYFARRARESQIGAWASKQSSAMAARADLDARIVEISARFEGRDVPRPQFWSGFRVVPQSIEFWTRESARLHVREHFERTGDGWARTMLYP
jgi:pyridoxamine 5'-phosphate oxidase